MFLRHAPRLLELAEFLRQPSMSLVDRSLLFRVERLNDESVRPWHDDMRILSDAPSEIKDEFSGEPALQYLKLRSYRDQHDALNSPADLGFAYNPTIGSRAPCGR